MKVSLTMALLTTVCCTVNTATAQTSDPYANSLLQQANRAIADNQRWIRQEGIPAVQRRQAFLRNLMAECNAGNLAACQRAKFEYDGQSRHTDQLIQQQSQIYGPGWVRSFGALGR